MKTSPGQRRIRHVTVLTPCYNEVENLNELTERIRKVFSNLPEFTYTHLFIDNASTDGTVGALRKLTETDRRIKVIVNARNFGHIRSPVYGLLEAEGDAVILMASDLQDPPEMIPELLQKWVEGAKVVMAVKNQSEESPLFFAVRRFYYAFLRRIATVELPINFTGTGLYDRKVLKILKKIDDPYPYFRGLIAELGFPSAVVFFTQPCRKRGFSKNNFFTLYDMAMLGITNHSRVPLRVATIFGFGMSAFSFLTAIGYVVAKLLFWNNFPIGIAPLLIGFFLMSSLLLFFIGLLGEYIGVVLTQVQKRPLVVELERIGFDELDEEEMLSSHAASNITAVQFLGENIVEKKIQ